MVAVTAFSYEEAFSRNLGWLTPMEQQIIRGKRIAIAGLGGVGGAHLLTLTRLGVGAFHISDKDTFELANFNRQAGATLSSIGKPKSSVMARMALDINPELNLKIFTEGIQDNNIDSFLEGVDIYVDGLDFFALDLRRKLIARCKELSIPVITAAPVGMGTAYLIFLPESMSFENYFRFDGLTEEQQLVSFAVGLAPKGFQIDYLMDLSRVDFKSRRVPTTGLSCELCAGVTAAQVVKILLKRGSVHAAPYFHHYDAFANQWKLGWLPFGNGNPLQKLKLFFTYRKMEKLSQDTVQRPSLCTRDIESILEQARWAPSGDNIQPWRFEIIDDDHLTIDLITPKSRGADDFYDFNTGQPTLLDGGALLETIRIAASQYSRSIRWSVDGYENGIYRISVELPHSSTVTRDPLLSYIPIRSVDRRMYRSTPLHSFEKQALQEALGNSFNITWRETLSERWKSALLSAKATGIRLRCSEAYGTHKRIIDWQHNFSETGIPSSAIGLDPLSRKLMRWLMRDWKRINFMNRFLGGTLLAQLQLDILPGLFCGAHFTIHSNTPPEAKYLPHQSLLAGQAIQRFWLTATSQGLVLQPNLAIIMLSFAGKEHKPFTQDAKMFAKAKQVYSEFSKQTGKEINQIAFAGRLGFSLFRKITARSVRRSLESLTRKKSKAPNQILVNALVRAKNLETF